MVPTKGKKVSICLELEKYNCVGMKLLAWQIGVFARKK